MSALRPLLLASTVLAMLLPPEGAQTQSRHCPPGLAKKAVPCVPPGQVWKRGDHLPDGYAILDPEEWRRHGLSRPTEGTVYAEADGQLLLVSALSRIIVEVLRGL